MKKRIVPILMVIGMIAVVIGSALYVNYNISSAAQAVELREIRVNEYAGIVAKTINVQEGDRVIVRAENSQSDFVNLVAEKCYEAGAQGVKVIYSDSTLINLYAKHLKDKGYSGYYYEFALNSYIQSTFPEYKTISIVSQNFDKNAATKEEKSQFITMAEAEIGAFMQEHSLVTENPTNSAHMSWTMAPYPTRSWAKKVYPELSTEAAYNQMLDDFLDFARTGNSEDFFAHVDQLTERGKKANEMNIVELHYKSKTADLRVPLHKNNVFAGGKIETKEGVPFYPNVPTEEIFTMPAKYGANGTITATRPLILNGELVDGLKMTFKDGKLVDCSADAGEDIIKSINEASPTGIYLGEAALVPKASQIFQSKKVYYEILLDENAGAHIALGNALADFNLKPGVEADNDVNEADYHIDVTIGSDDLTVTATLADGSQVDLIKNGLWFF